VRFHRKQKAWYRAHDRFARMTRDPRYMVRFALDPGDFVLYDNHRMLHARTGCRGARWMRGVYFDLDGTSVMTDAAST
jgi:gamma-butyrobetaine dioxygenase/trimethyllysine dioxygenase